MGYNFTYMVLNIIALIFDLGKSYGNVRSGTYPENVWKTSWKSLEIYIQNCVGTLHIARMSQQKLQK